MILTTLLISSYILIATFALVMTYGEQQRTGDRSFALKTLGFLACVFWPVTFLTVAVAARTA